MNDKLSCEEKKELPDSVFGLPERREYPMPDAAHVRAAESYFRYCPEELKHKLAQAIIARAKEFGVEVESPTVLAYAKTPASTLTDSICNRKLRERGRS